MIHRLRFILRAVTWWRVGAILHLMWLLVFVLGLAFLTPLANLVRKYRPELPGSAPEAFVGNSAVSAIVVLFTTGVFAFGIASVLQWRENRIETRIKRGLCPKCAYPVGTNDVCSECGAPKLSGPTGGGTHNAVNR